MARIPANKGVYQKTHICPTCGVEFSGPQVRPPGGRLSKQCPAGHWHSMHELSRRVTAAEAQRCAQEIAGMRMRKLGVSAHAVDSLSIGLMAMVSAYERLQAQFPAGSQARALLDGAFGVPAKIARELVA